MFQSGIVARVLATTIAATSTTPAPSMTIDEIGSTAPRGSTKAVAPSSLGHSVVDGLFFLQGPNVREILRSAGVSGYSDEEITALLDATNSDESKTIVAAVEQEITASDPDYFTRLGDVVVSGSPAAVQRALQSAYDAMLETPTMAAAIEASDSVGYVPGEIGTTCGVAVVVALGAVIAVTAVAALNYALAANIAVGFNVAAGTNVAYQVNKVKTKSKGAETAPRFSAPVVAAVISVLRP